MSFLTPVDQSRLDSRCLGFFVLDNMATKNQDAAGISGLGRAALTYSLEAGIVSWRHPIGGERFTVALRDNPRIAQWEPMTAEKLSLLAIELGVWDSGSSLPAAVSEPAISVVVASPEGFVIHRDEFDQIAVSDVLRLAQHPDMAIARPESTDAWSMYRLDRDGDRYQGQLIHGILASVNEFRSTSDGNDVRRKMEFKASIGGTPGRAKIGYLNIRQSYEGRQVATVIIDEKRAPMVRLAFELYATGTYTLDTLAEILQEAGLTSLPHGELPVRPISRSKVGTSCETATTLAT